MFIIRRARIEDLATLLKLARMVHFINLPADNDIIAAKILHSRNCFIRAAADRHAASSASAGLSRSRRRRPRGDRRPVEGNGLAGLATILSETDLFLFVLEDTSSASCIGTSQLIAHMGGPGNPIVSFQLSERTFFSRSLQTGTTQVVARLHLDTSSPSEIGGLILQPSFRRHKLRLGRLLSLVRFHFVGLHRHLFADRMVAEMMAPISPDGRNMLWEYLGRRFIGLSYTEADRFCQVSREFMVSLLPHDDLYLSLLPPEARAVVGQVGPETVPARRMLERLGFAYRGHVDPFDGGPLLEARTDDIPLVRATRWAELDRPVPAARCRRMGIISRLDTDGEFRAVAAPFAEPAADRVALSRRWLKLLHAEPGARVGLTPLDDIARSRPAAGGAARALDASADAAP